MKKGSYKLSVIVTAYNSAVLDKCLAAICASEFRNYEIIVVNDGGKDNATEIAKKYTRNVITHKRNEGRKNARRKGFKIAKGDILVNIDSDIIIGLVTLRIVKEYFAKNKSVDAITGILSENTPYQNFLSQYKNLYMNYHFRRLPESVNFLYGSIYAIRKNFFVKLNKTGVARVADDTDLGQNIVDVGGKISLVKSLKVKHYKKYTTLTFLRNDFRIPFDWAQIFLRYKGWMQLGRNSTGFAHASKEQIISIIISPFIPVFLYFGLYTKFPIFPLVLSSLWLFLNWNFLQFCYRKRGASFWLISLATTFLDNLVMLAGIISGAIVFGFTQFRETPR